jgi:hypothetical protein
MKPELERVKQDLETIQKALGLAPAVGREWLEWMKRDRWLSLWWCLPGFLLIVATLLPVDHAQRHWGLVPDQWAGLLVAGVILGIGAKYGRTMCGRDGRSAGMVREAGRLNGLDARGLWFNLGLVVQLAAYFLWAKAYQIAFGPFWDGLFLLMGSSFLLAAVAARAWVLLGWAVPFLAYGLSLPLVEGPGPAKGVLFGLMFIAVALSFSTIQFWQIRRLEGWHDAD